MSETVADVLVSTTQQIGVKQISGTLSPCERSTEFDYGEFPWFGL
jgi:hypothetical protein